MMTGKMGELGYARVEASLKETFKFRHHPNTLRLPFKYRDHP
jgi:hypothetical protein